MGLRSVPVTSALGKLSAKSNREGHYVLPNDEPEQDRQDLLHHVRNLVLNGCLFRACYLGTGEAVCEVDGPDSGAGTNVESALDITVQWGSHPTFAS
jgi:hypothetical protein